MSTSLPRKSLATPVSPAPSCTLVLQACDKALTDTLNEVDIKKLLILDMTNQNITLQNENEDLKASAGEFWHNPWVMTSLGLVLGVLGGVYAAKH